MVKFTSDGNRKENYFHFDARVGFRIYLRFVTVVGMAKAEQQSSEQGVQGRFSYGRFRAVVSFMHKNLKKVLSIIHGIPGSSIHWHCSAKNK